MTRIVICGITGRMGTALAGMVAAADDLQLAGGIATSDMQADDNRDYSVVQPERCAQLVRAADVIVDFSAPTAIMTVLRAAADVVAGKGFVIGTTGLSPADEQLIEETAGTAAVVKAANFSVGVNVLLDLVTKAARALGEAYDIEIVETHHRNKLDAPSGTALVLGRAAAAGRNVELHAVRRDGRSGDTGVRPVGEIAFHALRGGAVAGEHRVHFLGADERIELAHTAGSRDLFADGALTAARWVRGRAPGLYTMQDVLGL